MSPSTPPSVLSLSGGILSTSGCCTPCFADVLQIGVKLKLPVDPPARNGADWQRRRLDSPNTKLN
jgi:hypothetical protein